MGLESIVVRLAPKKVAQLLDAASKQLSPAEYQRFAELLARLQVGVVLTPEVNVELGALISKISWTLEIAESPEWAEALIACDAAYLGYELRNMFEDFGMVAPRKHKKELCRILYHLGHPLVVQVMEPYLRRGELG